MMLCEELLNDRSNLLSLVVNICMDPNRNGNGIERGDFCGKSVSDTDKTLVRGFILQTWSFR